MITGGNYMIVENVIGDFESDRIRLTESCEVEASRLQLICDAWNEGDKLLLEGDSFEDDYIEKCLKNGDLPPIPTAKIDKYSIKSIYTKEDNKLIGFFDMYHGYPNEDTLYISMFLISMEYQGKGYSSEVIEMLKQEAKKHHFKKIGLGVHLKNWKGLRFWFKNGFTQINGIYGDKEYSTGNFSFIGLECSL